MREILIKKYQINTDTPIDTNSSNFAAFASELDEIFQEEIMLDLLKVSGKELDSLFAMGLSDITAMDIRIIETFLCELDQTTEHAKTSILQD